MKAIFEGGRVRAPCQTCGGALSTFSYKDETGEFDSVKLISMGSGFFVFGGGNVNWPSK